MLVLHAAVVNNGYAYVIGGFGGTYLQDIEWKKLTTPGPATNFVITGAPASATVGDCMGPITIALESADSDATWADQTLAVDLTATNGGWHSDSSCSDNALTNVTIVGGLDSRQLYLGATSAGTLTANAFGSGLGAANTSVTIAEAPDGGTQTPASGDNDAHTVNGWGCSSAPGGWIALLALGAAMRARRKNA